MKIFIIALILGLSYAARLTVNDPECTVFIGKFGTANSTNGTGATKLAFNGDVSFADGTANVQVNLRYSDDTYFNDPKYYGLTKEDGHTLDETCLDLHLYTFTNKDFLGAIEVTDLPITGSKNEANRWRYLSFTITGDQLKNRLQVAQTTTQYTYTGYFAVQYAIGTQRQFTFYFTFSVIVNKSTSAAVSTVFKPLSDTETNLCKIESGCTVTPSSSFQFCTNSTCADFTTSPNIYLNDNFWMLQKIATPGLTQNYLSAASIRYTSTDGALNKPATIDKADYSVKGQATYTLKATIAWDKVQITVTSTMNTNAGSRRLLVSGDQGSTLGVSSETCVKLPDATSCPTCSEMESKNTDGEAPSTCNYSSMLYLVTLAIILLFI